MTPWCVPLRLDAEDRGRFGKLRSGGVWVEMAFSGVRVFADVVLECEMLAPVRDHPLYGFCTDPAGGE